MGAPKAAAIVPCNTALSWPAGYLLYACKPCLIHQSSKIIIVILGRPAIGNIILCCSDCLQPLLLAEFFRYIWHLSSSYRLDRPDSSGARLEGLIWESSPSASYWRLQHQGRQTPGRETAGKHQSSMMWPNIPHVVLQASRGLYRVMFDPMDSVWHCLSACRLKMLSLRNGETCRHAKDKGTLQRN